MYTTTTVPTQRTQDDVHDMLTLSLVDRCWRRCRESRVICQRSARLRQESAALLARCAYLHSETAALLVLRPAP